MEWLLSIDHSLFRVLNQTFSSPWLDLLMPQFSGSPLFPLLVLAVAAAFAWFGQARGRFCVLVAAVAVALSDASAHAIKKQVARARPSEEVSAILRSGQGKPPNRNSMPSAHAANWAAATTVLLLIYRRRGLWIVPLAAAVGFSRIYLGVHYPSDVLVGALLGGCAGAFAFWAISLLGRKLFPAWMPAAAGIPMPVENAGRSITTAADPALLDYDRATYAYRAGILLIVVMALSRIVYLSSDRMELTEDEAYQWLWSKHLDWSYFSKPPLIAFAQFAGTALWDDTTLGVRFFSPVFAACLSLITFMWLRRQANIRVAWAMLVMTTAAPMLAAGSILMTVDPLNVFFWTSAMVCGWFAIKKDHTGYWVLTGFLMGLGFLSKYTTLLQWACWAVWFLLWPPARAQLRRPGPYFAMAVFACCTLPVLVWNAQHDWITVKHVSENGQLHKTWEPTLRHTVNFLITEGGLLNPIFFVAMIWAAIAFWKRFRHDELMVFCFSMGAPVFLFYFVYSFRARILENWIAPCVVPLFCLAALYWERRYQEGLRPVKTWLVAGVALALPLIILAHDTNLVKKLTGLPLPADLDPLRRAQGFSRMAQIVGTAREDFEGKNPGAGECFIIANHYGLVGHISFYLPQAKARVKEEPLVYYMTRPAPVNQFYFWPGYRNKVGCNAVFVDELKKNQARKDPPKSIVQEFESVEDLGVFSVTYRKREMRRIQIYGCRNLLPPADARASIETR